MFQGLMQHLDNLRFLLAVQDVEKLCSAIQNDVSVLGCLRENKAKLSTACADEVFQRQQVAVDDWRTDKELATACKVRVRGCVRLRKSVLPTSVYGHVRVYLL